VILGRSYQHINLMTTLWKGRCK